MAFLTAVASSRFPLTHNQLRTSSNSRNQATIQDNRVTMQQVQGRQGQSYAGNGYKGNAMSFRGNNAGGQARVTEDLDAYDSDCDDVSNAKAVLMANLSNYGSDVISEAAVQDTNLYAQQDSMILSVIEQMSEQMINHVNNWEKANQEKNNESLTAELERYKERVKTFEQRLNIDLSTREKMIDSQMDDMIKEKLALKQQIDSLEQNLSNQIKEKESLLQTFTVFKNESKEKESKYMDKEIDLEKKIKELDNIVYKVGQSAQTVHMLTKPQVFYDDTHKQALGYQNPFYLKKAQRIKPTLYDGSVISSQHVASPVIDDEETLILEEVSRSKMLAKQNDPMSKEKKVNTTPINYVELNRLSEDFGKRFVPQQELSDEQAFWLQTSHPNTDQSASSPVKIEAPKELPKVSLVNTSLKKLKYHLGQFDTVVKKRITPDAITEGEWGFEHTKAVFLKEIIPFLKTLKDIFNVFDKDLLNEEKANQEKNNESLTAELERYKERVKTFEQRLNIDLSTREKMIDSQMDDMIKEKLALKQQIDSLEQNLSNQIKEKESLLQTFTVFKNESKEKESKYMDKEIDLEKKIKELDNIVYKVGQSAQTVHMLTKPQVFYDDTHKQALGYQNLFYLKKAQRIKPTLYDGSVISSQHVASPVIDDEETLILEEVSRSKMLAKQNDPMSKEKKVNTTPINYVELNRLSKDFGKRFVPQQELSDEQAFWLQTLHPNTDQSASSPVKIEAPKELPKVSLVNTSLKKLKYHLGQFDTVVKKQITPDAITKGEWGFEHTKAVFLKEIIPFLKTLKDIFNVFDKDLLNEVTEVQTVFNQMEAAVQQYFVDKQYVMICVMNSTAVFDDVNVELQSSQSCVKCLDLDAELLKSQNAYNDLSKKYFENNDLKAQLQAKDTTICKWKEHIKLMRENDKEEKVKHEMDEIETINIELEHKNVDLKGQIQEKVFVTTALQSELRRLKGLKCSTSTCRSQPKGNKRNDRISQTPVATSE
ncbi:hypothetical protein Tco_0429668 [Tanacetum coccineum]